jgi:hypothetical protein
MLIWIIIETLKIKELKQKEIMCKQFNKRLKKINENHAWQQYLEEFKSEYLCGPEIGRIICELKQVHSKDLLGSYIDQI